MASSDERTCGPVADPVIQAPVALALIDAVLHGRAAGDPSKAVARELIVVLELEPINETPRVAALAPIHQPQQRLAGQLAQHRGSETITKQSRLLSDLRGCHQLARRKASVKRRLQ